MNFMSIVMGTISVFAKCVIAMALSELTCATTLAGTNFYVSPTGLDSNDGTSVRPWKTIQKAANSATPGSVVHVLAGTYHEMVTVTVSGNAAQGAITFQGKNAILDYVGTRIKSGQTGAFHIEGQSYVKIIGFEIRNYIAGAAAALPVGIHVRGASHHIELRGNRIHHIENNLNGSSNAHGIAIYGTGRTAATAIHDIAIVGNELFSLKLGASEALVVNGNVDGFVIESNSIHNCNNIGIDAIGFEGTSIVQFDQARNGWIAKNIVTHIDSRGNPAYGTDRSANGIYVDGGKSITIDGNTVTLCNIGIELASEHAGRVTSLITVSNNVVRSSHTVGFSMGGYDSRRGGTESCMITGNTFHGNDTDGNGSGEVQLQYHVRNNVIRNNNIWSTQQNVLISNPFATSTGNVVDNNNYYSPGGPSNSTWLWNNREYTDFAIYRLKTGNDAHSVFRTIAP